MNSKSNSARLLVRKNKKREKGEWGPNRTEKGVCHREKKGVVSSDEKQDLHKKGGDKGKVRQLKDLIRGGKRGNQGKRAMTGNWGGAKTRREDLNGVGGKKGRTHQSTKKGGVKL